MLSAPKEGTQTVAAASRADLDLALRALADGNRRAILQAIRNTPLPVGSIAEVVGLSQQTTSHHLGVLTKAGLTTSSREGTRHLFAVGADGLASVRSYLDDFWPSKLSTLKSVIENHETRSIDEGEHHG